MSANDGNGIYAVAVRAIGHAVSAFLKLFRIYVPTICKIELLLLFTVYDFYYWATQLICIGIIGIVFTATCVLCMVH